MARKLTETASIWSKATTIPADVEGLSKDDPRRSWDGPSEAGPARLRVFLVKNVDGFDLYLTPVSDEEAASLSRDRFQGEAEYNERVIVVMKDNDDILPRHAFTAENLERRLARCKTLDEVVIVLAGLLDRLRRTAHLEWSNLTQLSDAVMSDLESQLRRSVLHPDMRVRLANAASVPLETWQSRQDGIARARAEGRSRGEEGGALLSQLAEANARVAAAERRIRELEERLGAGAPLPPTPTPPGPAELTRAQPSRRSRKRT